MPKEKEEISMKEFKKLQTQTQKLNQAFGDNVKDLDSKIETNINILDKKIESGIKNLDTELSSSCEELDKKLETNISTLQKTLESVKSDIEVIRNDFQLHGQRVQEIMKNQEKVILSIMNKFKKEIKDNNTKFESDIDAIKREQDTLKISFTVNENKLMDVIKLSIENEMRVAVQGKEDELLMKYWIEELKSILSNFEKLKKKQPKEFELQINEIADTIELFKERLKR